jgi:hypothetical protein
MWLPTPLYERMPQFWLVLGLLFFSYSFYQGLSVPASLESLIMGLACWIYGIGISVARARYRGANLEDNNSMVASQ